MEHSAILQEIERILKRDFERQYYCHLQFVREISLKLQREFGGATEVIEIAALAHDIGRGSGSPNGDHAEIGAAKISELLSHLGVHEKEILKIANCVLMHSKTSGFTNIEDEIVANADKLSKLEAHDSFLLMVKSENYLDRARWGLKYIEKSYRGLTLPNLQHRHASLYQAISERYTKILAGR